MDILGRTARTVSDIRRHPAGAHLAISGTCILLAVLLAVRFRTIRPLSVPLKLADGAFEAAGFLLSGGPLSPPHLFLLSSKTLLKAYKVARRIKLIEGGAKGSSFGAGRLKAVVGLANLARYVVVASVGGKLGIDLLKVGYKASKSVGNIFEGLMRIQIDARFRGGMEALGMCVNAMSLYRGFVKVAGLGSKSSTCRFVGQAAPYHYSYCCLVAEKVRLGGEVYKIEAIDDTHRYLPLHISERFDGEEKLDYGLSELLSLSIPIRPSNGLLFAT